MERNGFGPKDIHLPVAPKDNIDHIIEVQKKLATEILDNTSIR